MPILDLMTPEAKAAGRGAGSSVTSLVRGAPSRGFWGLNRRVWSCLPMGARDSRGGLAYGRWIHGQVQKKSTREMYVWSTFLRNRPKLELMRRLVQTTAEELNAERRGARLQRRCRGLLDPLDAPVDLPESRDRGPRGGHLSGGGEGRHRPASTFLGMSEVVAAGIFERTDRPRDATRCSTGTATPERVKDWLREGIEWHVDDACDPGLGSKIGSPRHRCGEQLPLSHGSGERGALPSQHRAAGQPGRLHVRVGRRPGRASQPWREIWGGNPWSICSRRSTMPTPALRSHWPWEWAGLEPLDRRRSDWRTRYATAFRIDGSKARATASRM